MCKLSILSNPKNLVNVRKKVKLIANKTGFSKEETSNIVLAVDEACTNIIRHSYSNDYTKKINIKVDLKPKKLLKIIIRDYGIKPNLKKISSLRPQKIKPGGLGVYFMKKIMDEVIYDTNVKKGTRLTLIKYANKS